eukprot:scaffold3337_cov204-Alexandrium_tamarense.AAC.7
MFTVTPPRQTSVASTSRRKPSPIANFRTHQECNTLRFTFQTKPVGAVVGLLAVGSERCVKWRRSTERRRTTTEEGITNATFCSIKGHTFTPV